MITPALSNAPTATASEPQVADFPPTTSVGPYAMPNATVGGRAVDAIVIDAIRAASGPFVPAPWRDQHARRESASIASSEQSLATVEEQAEIPETVVVGSEPEMEYEAEGVAPELPWIDAFADIPEMGTVSQGTREEQGEQASNFVDETPIPVYSDAATDWSEEGAEAPLVAERLALMAPLPDDVAVEAVPAEASDLRSLLDSQNSPALSKASESSFESAWQDAEPIEEEGVVEANFSLSAEPEPTQNAEPPHPEVAQNDVTECAEYDLGEEDWPLADAADIMRSLADSIPPSTQLPRQELGRPYATPLGVPPIALTSPLPMWDDEEAIDLMPVKLDPLGIRASEQWSRTDSGESVGALNGSPEIGAAAAIETIARRIRRGELAIPGYSKGMSDAAALAAALTALLSAAA